MIIPIVFILTTFIAFLIRNGILSNVPFYDWDESIYAQVASEMIHSHTIFTTYNGSPWLEKPPFPYPLFGGMLAIFGYSEFWARMVIVISAVILLVLTYLLSKKIMEHFYAKRLKDMPRALREGIYLIPCFIIGVSPQFLDRSSIINVDIFLAISWIGYFLYKDNPLLKGVFLFVGVMTKSLLGFYPLLLEIFLIRKKSFTKKNIFSFAIIIAACLIWYVVSYIYYGNTFIQVHFLDHMVRRLTTPIELHFGGRIFYAQLLLQNLTIFIFVSLISYCFMLKDIWQKIRSNIFKIFELDHLWDYIVLFSPIPFFILLTLGKSKLSWYLFPLLPLFALAVPYLVLKIKNYWITGLITLGIFGYFIVQFIPSTLLLEPAGTPEKVALAKCISKLPQQNIAFLVNDDERKIQNVLEAAHLDISTSYDYGGSPAFVFYTHKHVDFYYNVDQFIKGIKSGQILVVNKEDYEGNTKMHDVLIQEHYLTNCSTNSWVSFVQ